MKIFDRDGKVNFVDENNVFVGYDMRQCCCETAGYCFLDFEPQDFKDTDREITLSEEVMDGLIFDTRYFTDLQDEATALDHGRSVCFKLVGKDKVFYLVLYNFQNGYYEHGFETQVNGKMWREGTL